MLTKTNRFSIKSENEYLNMVHNKKNQNLLLFMNNSRICRASSMSTSVFMTVVNNTKDSDSRNENIIFSNLMRFLSIAHLKTIQMLCHVFGETMRNKF